MAREVPEVRAPVARRGHSVTIEEQQRVRVTGVEDVDSFDENQIVLLTATTGLSISGGELHISLLDLEDGELVVEGNILALEYAPVQQGKRPGLFSRMLGGAELAIPSTLNQIYVWLAAMLGGMAIGLLYDLVYCVQAGLRPPAWLRALLAILFCAGALAVHGANMMWLEGGNFRLFPFLAAGVGFVLYRASWGQLVRAALLAILKGLAKGIRAVCGTRRRIAENSPADAPPQP